MLEIPEAPYYSAPEDFPHRFYEGRQADVWNCGIILVSAQNGLILTADNLKYFMLAGFLPFPGGITISEGYDARLPLCNIPNTPLTFPVYFPHHPRDLLRRMLVERAELFDVAHHSWLADYSDMIRSFIIVEKGI